MRSRNPRRSTVHRNNNRIFFRRVEIMRIQQPALNVVAVALPRDAFCLAPCGLQRHISLRDLFPIADRPRPDFRRRAERMTNDRNPLSIGSHREHVAESVARRNRLAGPPQIFDPPRRSFHGSDAAVTARVRCEQDALPVRHPGKPARRRFDSRRDVPGFAAGCADREDIVSGQAFIAHQPGDKRDLLAIRRPRRINDLQRRLVDGFHLPARRLESIKFGDVPIVVAIAVRRGHRESFAVGRPVVFVDVHVRGRNLLRLAAARFHHCEPLFKKYILDLARLRRFRHQRPGRSGRVLREKKRNERSVRRPSRR